MYIVRVNQLVMNALTPRIPIRTAAFNSRSFKLNESLLRYDNFDRVHTRTEMACQASSPRKPFAIHLLRRNTPFHAVADAMQPHNLAGSSVHLDRSLPGNEHARLLSTPATNSHAAFPFRAHP